MDDKFSTFAQLTIIATLAAVGAHAIHAAVPCSPDRTLDTCPGHEEPGGHNPSRTPLRVLSSTITTTGTATSAPDLASWMFDPRDLLQR